MPARPNVSIVLREGHDTVESALSRLKKEMLKSGLFNEVKRRAYFLKPGERKRIKSAAARKNIRKATRKREAMSEEASLRAEELGRARSAR